MDESPALRARAREFECRRGSAREALDAGEKRAQIFRRRRVERVIRADSLASRGLSWYLGNQLGEVAEWLKALAC